MINGYEEFYVESLKDEIIDELYLKLLESRNQFFILNFDKKIYCLTKERTIVEILNKQKFLQDANQDIYYRTIVKNENICIDENDLKLFWNYVNKYKNQILQNRFGKYLFGSIAVKTKNGFITTIRGKENLEDYTIVKNVDHKTHIIIVANKKATLNAPLLDYIFKNSKVKVIVHLHQIYENLPYQDYAFPGTVKDTFRNNKTSFNIKNHGVMYLFDGQENLI